MASLIPKPWDDSETFPEMDRNIVLHGLFEDVLPDHSTPLIIHHGSALGDWLRQIEESTGVTFGRDGTWIEWWNYSFLDKARACLSSSQTRILPDTTGRSYCLNSVKRDKRKAAAGNSARRRRRGIGLAGIDVPRVCRRWP